VSIEHDSIAIMRSAIDYQLVYRKHRMRNTPIANIPFVDLFLRDMHSSCRFRFLNLSRLPALLSCIRYHFFLVLDKSAKLPYSDRVTYRNAFIGDTKLISCLDVVQGEDDQPATNQHYRSFVGNRLTEVVRGGNHARKPGQFGDLDHSSGSAG